MLINWICYTKSESEILKTNVWNRFLSTKLPFEFVFWRCEITKDINSVFFGVDGLNDSVANIVLEEPRKNVGIVTVRNLNFFNLFLNKKKYFRIIIFTMDNKIQTYSKYLITKKQMHYILTKVYYFLINQFLNFIKFYFRCWLQLSGKYLINLYN